MEDEQVTNYEKKATGYFEGTRPEMLQFIPKSCERLLDIGCGAGGFGGMIKKELGAEVWGIEISSAATKIARKRIDKVINEPFSSQIKELSNQHFDVITFNDVLEHFPDPYPPLEICKKKLSENGVVVCSLPNVRYIENVYHFLIDMDWKYTEQGILDNTHLKFFTKKSMIRTFKNAGYDIVSIIGIRSHYWSGKKIFLLRLFFDKWMADMKFMNYVIVAKPKKDI